MKKRIVVTGMGVITSNADNIEQYCEALINGRSGIKEITLFDSTDYYFPYMGEIAGFKSPHKELDRASQLALYAAKEAVRDGKEEWILANRASTGVVIGTTCGGVTTHEQIMRDWHAGNSDTSNVNSFDEVPFHVMANHIARNYGFQGPVATITIACASGSNAVGYAADLIRNGQADIMLAGGSDTVSHFTFSGFSVLRAMARDACRPFDKNRTGIALGEGAAILVLEEAQQAIKRGAKIYCEILGYGFCNDAYHSTSPDPKGRGLARSINHVLSQSLLSTKDIDYINAHGTGTRHNDLMECNAYKSIFGQRQVPVSSTKSMIGHTLGAAGAVELAASILALREQFLPPTINSSAVDPACGFDIVPNQSRKAKLKHVICCNAGFAGNNTAVIIGSYTEGKNHG